jgi:ATP-dependent helicase HrpB
MRLRIAALQDAAKFERERPFAIDRTSLARVKEAAKRLQKGSGSKGPTSKGSAADVPAGKRQSGEWQEGERQAGDWQVGERQAGERQVGERQAGEAPMSEAPTSKAPTGEGPASIGALLARAYPDRVCLRRPGDAPRFLMSGGKGAYLDEQDALAGERLLVAADLDGDAREARIRLAAPITQAEVDEIFSDRIAWRDVCAWSDRERRVIARSRRLLGALALDDRIWKDAPAEALGAAIADGVASLGLACLPWTGGAERLASRVRWAAAHGVSGLPDWTEDALMATLGDWLTPHLAGMRDLNDLKRLDLHATLANQLDWTTRQSLDQAAPPVLVAPSGHQAPINYGRAQPTASLRPQALYGLDTHPTVGPSKLPLTLELLSPADRPIQTTADLPRFWRTTWADVRKDMRGRYPKHDWPEDPAKATPPKRRR